MAVKTNFSKVPKQVRSSETVSNSRSKMFVIGTFALFGLGLLLILTAILKPQPKVDYSQVIPTGQSVAQAMATQVVSGQQVQIPHVASLTMGDLDVPTAPYPVASAQHMGFYQTQVTGEGGVQQFEVHRFLLIPASPEANGTVALKGADQQPPVDKDSEDFKMNGESAILDNLYNKDGKMRLVPMVMDVSLRIIDEKAYLAAAPALEPWAMASEPPVRASGDYSDFNAAQSAPATATKALGTWAKAYVEDNRPALQALTGDPDPGHQYIGLGGMTLSSEKNAVKAINSVPIGEDTLVVRMRVLVESTTQLEGQENPTATYLDMDVRVDNASTASPKVSAWGPAGSADQLQPYMNAFTPR